MSVRITIRAKPRAKKSRISHAEGLTVDVQLSAPPVDGAANEELLRVLAAALRIRVSALSLVLGQSSKNKVVEVRDLDAATVTELLRVAAG